MTDFRTFSVQRRDLRAAMRRARREHDLSHQQAAELIGWSPSKIIRIENGVTSPQPSDVLALLTAYGVNRDRIDELFKLARTVRDNRANDARERLAQIHSPSYLSYLEYEQASRTMKEWQNSLFPGLTQTEEYAFEILTKVFGNSRENAEKRIAARIDRQQLVETGTGPRFHFILDEAVLVRTVGGPKIMIRQLEHMLEVSAMERAIVQLLPFEKGPTPGLRGPFILLEFEDDRDDDVLYMETPRGDFFARDDVGTTSDYQVIFGGLEKLALKEDAFEERVHQIIDSLRRA